MFHASVRRSHAPVFATNQITTDFRDDNRLARKKKILHVQELDPEIDRLDCIPILDTSVLYFRLQFFFPFHFYSFFLFFFFVSFSKILPLSVVVV